MEPRGSAAHKSTILCVAACLYLAIDAVQSLLGAQRTLRQPVATTFSQAAGVTLIRETRNNNAHTHNRAKTEGHELRPTGGKHADSSFKASVKRSSRVGERQASLECRGSLANIWPKKQHCSSIAQTIPKTNSQIFAVEKHRRSCVLFWNRSPSARVGRVPSSNPPSFSLKVRFDRPAMPRLHGQGDSKPSLLLWRRWSTTNVKRWARQTTVSTVVR